MNLSRRERTLAAMLQRWHELATPEPGQWGGRGSNGLLGANHGKTCAWLTVDHRQHQGDCDCWLASFAELERCLDTMRKLGKQKAVLVLDHKGQAKETIALGKARWHLLAWYRDVSYQSVPIHVTKVVAKHRGGQRRWEKVQVETGRRLQPIRHRDARQERAEAGLRFLAALYRGTPQLPQDIAKLERAA